LIAVVYEELCYDCTGSSRQPAALPRDAQICRVPWWSWCC